MRSLAILFALLLVSTASAAEIERLELKDGRTVILNDDQTWSFASDVDDKPSSYQDVDSAATEGCTKVKSKLLPVSVCLLEEDWERVELPGGFEISFEHDTALFGGFVTERTYLPKKFLRKAIIKRIDAKAGLQGAKILDSGVRRIDAVDWGYLQIESEYEDLPFKTDIYYNSMPEGSVQFILFGESSFFDKYTELRKRVASQLRITTN